MSKKIDATNYSMELKKLATAEEKNAFVSKHYEKAFGHKPTNAYYDGKDGKVYYAHASATLCKEMGFAPATKTIANKLAKMQKTEAPKKVSATKVTAKAKKEESRIEKLEARVNAMDKKLEKILKALK